MDDSLTKSPTKVLFLEAKKRGRPKKDEDQDLKHQLLSSLGLKKCKHFYL